MLSHVCLYALSFLSLAIQIVGFPAPSLPQSSLVLLIASSPAYSTNYPTSLYISSSNAFLTSTTSSYILSSSTRPSSLSSSNTYLTSTTTSYAPPSPTSPSQWSSSSSYPTCTTSSYISSSSTIFTTLSPSRTSSSISTSPSQKTGVKCQCKSGAKGTFCGGRQVGSSNNAVNLIGTKCKANTLYHCPSPANEDEDEDDNGQEDEEADGNFGHGTDCTGGKTFTGGTCVQNPLGEEGLGGDECVPPTPSPNPHPPLWRG